MTGNRQNVARVLKQLTARNGHSRRTHIQWTRQVWVPKQRQAHGDPRGQGKKGEVKEGAFGHRVAGVWELREWK